MRYRLSLDLGVGSIGAAVLPLDEKNRVTDIKDKGVCIFEVSEGAENRRLKRGQRKNTERTRKRLSLLSETLVKAGLWSFDDDTQEMLIKLSPYAIRAQGVNGKLNDIMQLGRAVLHMAKHRGAGFVEMQKVELENKKDEDENTRKKKNTVSEYAKLAKCLEDTGARTIGEYFFMRLHKSYKNNNIDDENRRYVRQRKTGDKIKVDYAIPRYLVKEEFNLLWDKQASYYKSLKNKALKQKIHDILFYEKYHRPYATGKCIFIDTEQRLCKAHPLSEERRIYESVNNIRIQQLEEQRKLTKDERDLIIKELLLKGQKIGQKGQAIRKRLKIDKNFNIVLADSIKPYLYSTPEYMAIDFLNKLDDEKLAEIVEFMSEPRLEDGSEYLYNDQQVIDKLKEKLGIDDEKQISKLLAMLPKGRGALGKTATIKILELLKKDVISIREATDQLSKADKRFIAEEERIRAIQGKYDKLPYYGEILKTDTQPIADWQKQTNKSLNPLEAKYGKIANPAVHRILNQLRKVVNDIIRIYGKPYDINIELAREVGMSTKRKAKYEKQQKENRKKNDNAVEYLKEHKIRVTRDNILKWRLAQEQNWKDAFTLERIHPRFEGFEIEHLIPDSLGGTDAPMNRVLIKRSDNLNKGNMYPYEYLQNKHSDKVYGILKEIRANINVPDGKKWRFESDAKEKFESGEDVDNITRYLTDTRYVCKLSARYLKAIIDYKQDDENNTRVLTINGAHTAKLRGIWNLDGIEYDLMGLNDEVPKYLPDKTHFVNLDTGEILYQEKLDIDGNWKRLENQKNDHWKKKPRIDHRHHIIDAITIGMVSRSDMQNINWHDKRGYEVPFMQLPVPLSGEDSDDRKKQLVVFRDKVIESLKDVTVYHKPEHSKNGQLHKETARLAFMKNPDKPTEVVTKYQRPASAVLDKKSSLAKLLINTKTIKPQWHDAIAKDADEMMRLKDAIESHFDEAEEFLGQENKQLVEDGKKAKKISEAMIVQRAFNITLSNGEYKLATFPEYQNKKSFVDIPKHKVVYDSGNNYCLNFYRDKKDNIGWEVVNQFNANQKDFVPQWKQKGFKPIWSVQQGDMIELDTPQQWKKYDSGKRCLAMIKKLGKGFTYIKYQTDARAENRNETENPQIKQDFIGGGLSFYVESGARKVEITPFGKIKRKHKKLCDGKKETVKQS